ncbi:MAG: glycoside hydrolase family 15 protein [Deltaproteobacteria bacterium]|nr:glycoside hydrolase family 15 protein [Deltaproteobacteria bacterium]
MRLEDYALIGDTQTAALVSREGSVDWLCLPRFDSAACFAALLGTPKHGRWLITPAEPVRRTHRRYLPDSLVLETYFETENGIVRLVDCMPPRDGTPELVRRVEGLRGRVPMRLELVIRFDYGNIVPWVRSEGGRLHAIAGPDALVLTSDIETRGENMTTVADFTLSEGQNACFTLAWFPSHRKAPPALDGSQSIRDTELFWRGWVKRCKYDGPYRDAVVRSLMVLKALTYAPTGGIVAAPTTSLPEQLGGVRNWDYRFCWLRDAAFTLNNLYLAGYREEARSFRGWLLRAAAGDPAKLQVLYGVSGERRIPEAQCLWLPGYEGSRPVRVGNAAVDQLQLDIYGELLDAMLQSRQAEGCEEDFAWRVERVLLDFLGEHWRDPDESIWEVRGERRDFTYSKVMAWVAFDRAIRSAEKFGLEGPVRTWREKRARIMQEVLVRGVDPARGCFVQSFGSEALDASLLRIPLVGFLPCGDSRVQATIQLVERELMRDGLVLRYATQSKSDDGLPPGEGAFLACSFWLADCYARQGRVDQARELFERLLSLRNDVGLLAEEYDSRAGRQVGNFPQAFSHLALVNTAFNLAGMRAGSRGEGRPARDASPILQPL